MITMFDKIPFAEFKKYLQIEKERQLALQEVSEVLGIDIGFSDEEVVKNAEEQCGKAISDKMNKEINEWMKSAFS